MKAQTKNMNTYKIEDAQIKRGNGYGQYIITGTVNGENVKTRTTDSEAFDWFNDDSNPEKHEAAVYHIQMALKIAYDNL